MLEVLVEKRKCAVTIHEGGGNELEKYSYVCWAVLWDCFNHEIKMKRVSMGVFFSHR